MLYGDLPQVTLANGESAAGIVLRVAHPPKSALVRLPSPQEMTDRLSKQKSIRRSTGRRESTTETLPHYKADLELFHKIKIEGDDFDEYEASNSVGKLVRANVTACEREGEEFKITLNTVFGDTQHYMAVPSTRDLMIYRRSAVLSKDLPHGQEELRFPVEPPSTLYDLAVRRFEGYSASYKKEDIPPHHKSNVVMELVQAVEDLDAELNPNY